MTGQSQWCSSLAPPAAQSVILETRDRVSHQASCMELASPSACVSVYFQNIFITPKEIVPFTQSLPILQFL